MGSKGRGRLSPAQRRASFTKGRGLRAGSPGLGSPVSSPDSASSSEFSCASSKSLEKEKKPV